MDTQTLYFLQLTDTHLFKDDHSLLFNINTHQNFQRVIKKIETLEKKPDFFLLTGDLSQDESKASYQKLVDALEPFKIKTYWIPGNHDDVDVMTAVFNQSPLFFSIKKLILNHWDIIFLNTKKSGTDKGFLEKSELFRLENALKNVDKNKSIALVMHHHPLNVDTPLIDNYILINHPVFWEIVMPYSAVRLIICGHVHGDYSIKKNHISVECSPATCFQWKLGTSDLKIEPSIGFKNYYLSKNKYTCSTDFL